MKDKIVIFIKKYFISNIINLLYWIIHFYQLPKAIKEKKELSKNIFSIIKVERIINKFVWKKDSIDWYPWIITIINKKLTDDCDGAAILGQWLLKQINIKADIYHLRGEDSGHMICISADKKYMVTNNEFIYLSGISNWKEEVFELFKGKYKRIF